MKDAKKRGYDVSSSESENDNDIEEEELAGNSLFVNPLLAVEAKKKEKTDGDESEKEDDAKSAESWSDDEAEEERKKAAESDKKSKLELLGKRKRGKDLGHVGDFFTNEVIEEVPATDPATLAAEKGYDS